MPPQSAEIKVEQQANCPKGRELCGFEIGMQVIIFDTNGNYDTFVITNVQDSAGHLQHRQQPLNYPYAAGAQITQIVSNTYYLNRTTNKFMRYNGASEEIALADDVVDLRFEYFGDPAPPLLPKPKAGVANCLYDAAGNYIGPAAMIPTDGSLVELDAAVLSDGPFCGTGQNEFDADLLRVRKVRVSLRMQTASPVFRGADTSLFMKPGKAQGGQRYIPDYRSTFEVTPRNLNLAR
jgi:hypothetical protein